MADSARVRGFERRPGSRAWRLRPSLETRDPREQATRVAVAYLAALAVGLATVEVVPAPALVVPATVLGGGSLVLRWITLRGGRPAWAMAIDAGVVLVMLVLTDAPNSPFHLAALVGLLWAAYLRPGNGARVYGGLLIAGLMLLVVPGAAADGRLPEAISNVVAIGALAVLLDIVLPLDVRAVAELAGSPASVPGRTAPARAPVPALALAPDDATRRRVETAVADHNLPLDGVFAAARHDLTAAQAELLSYLLLGCTNADIARAISLSEATVKARLTVLYRTLGVRCRAEAVTIARSIGFDALIARAGDRGQD